jgi:hypothetical protein
MPPLFFFNSPAAFWHQANFSTLGLEAGETEKPSFKHVSKEILPFPPLFKGGIETQGNVLGVSMGQ